MFDAPGRPLPAAPGATVSVPPMATRVNETLAVQAANRRNPHHRIHSSGKFPYTLA
jgi:hypothetical protein